MSEAKRGAKAEIERTLDDLPDVKKGQASPSNNCRPDVCELDDRGEKWSGEVNFTCTRCPYATIDRDAARARNPRITA